MSLLFSEPLLCCTGLSQTCTVQRLVWDLGSCFCHSSLLKAFAVLFWVCPIHMQLQSDLGLNVSSYTEFGHLLSSSLLSSIFPTFSDSQQPLCLGLWLERQVLMIIAACAAMLFCMTLNKRERRNSRDSPHTLWASASDQKEGFFSWVFQCLRHHCRVQLRDWSYSWEPGLGEEKGTIPHILEFK